MVLSMGKIRWSHNSAKTQLKLHKDSDRVQNEDPRISITEQLLNKLRNACKFRPDVANQIFKGEWTGFQSALLQQKANLTITQRQQLWTPLK